jgi:hypothetical protein
MQDPERGIMENDDGISMSRWAVPYYGTKIVSGDGSNRTGDKPFGFNENGNIVYRDGSHTTSTHGMSNLGLERAGIQSDWLNACVSKELTEAQARENKLRSERDKALAAAVAAIYFDDNSDYLSALWSVVRTLGGEEAATLLDTDEQAAYKKYCGSVE